MPRFAHLTQLAATWLKKNLEEMLAQAAVCESFQTPDNGVVVFFWQAHHAKGTKCFAKIQF